MKPLLAVISTICALHLPAFPVFAGNFDVDDLKIKDLKKAGVNLKVPHKVAFLLSFKTEAAAQEALRDAEKRGFVKMSLSQFSANYVQLWVTLRLVPDIKAIKDVHKTLTQVATKSGGEYENDEWRVVP